MNLGLIFQKRGVGYANNFLTGNDLWKTVYCTDACTSSSFLGGWPIFLPRRGCIKASQVPFGTWLVGCARLALAGRMRCRRWQVFGCLNQNRHLTLLAKRFG